MTPNLRCLGFRKRSYCWRENIRFSFTQNGISHFSSSWRSGLVYSGYRITVVPAPRRRGTTIVWRR